MSSSPSLVGSCTDQDLTVFGSSTDQDSIGPPPDDETITLIVGPKQTPFQVSKRILCSKSNYFAACLNGGFAETQKKEFVLRDSYCGILEVILTWMYTGLLQYKQGESPEALFEKLNDENKERREVQRVTKHKEAMKLMKDSSLREYSVEWYKALADTMSQIEIEGEQWEASEDHIDCGLTPYQWRSFPDQHNTDRVGWRYDAAESWSWRSLIRIYLFSEYYGIHGLDNAVIDAMEKRLLRQRYIPSASDISLVYHKTLPDSVLQRLIVKYLAATIDWSWGLEGEGESPDFLEKCPQAFVISMLQRKDKRPDKPHRDIMPIDPRWVRHITRFKECLYHRHESEEERKTCSAQSTPWWMPDATDESKGERENDEADAKGEREDNREDATDRQTSSNSDIRSYFMGNTTRNRR